MVVLDCVKTDLNFLPFNLQKRTKNESQIRPELGDSQAGDSLGDSKNDCAKQNCAPYYAAKTGFLVRKEMVRSEVRSESMKMDRGG